MVELTNEFCQTYVSYTRCLLVSFLLLALMLFSPALFTPKKYRTAKYLYGFIYYAEKGDSLRIHLPALAATMLLLIAFLVQSGIGAACRQKFDGLPVYKDCAVPKWISDMHQRYGHVGGEHALSTARVLRAALSGKGVLYPNGCAGSYLRSRVFRKSRGHSRHCGNPLFRHRPGGIETCRLVYQEALAVDQEALEMTSKGGARAE